MREKLQAPGIAKKLIPQFGVGCRRLSPGDEYLISLGKPNVELIPSGVVQVTEDGVIDEDGNKHKADTIICATGFDTSYSPSYSVQGRGGVDLKAKFADIPACYLGIMVPDFPNFFCMASYPCQVRFFR